MHNAGLKVDPPDRIPVDALSKHVADNLFMVEITALTHQLGISHTNFFKTRT
jgi:hypothetical protein